MALGKVAGDKVLVGNDLRFGLLRRARNVLLALVCSQGSRVLEQSRFAVAETALAWGRVEVLGGAATLLLVCRLSRLRGKSADAMCTKCTHHACATHALRIKMNVDSRCFAPGKLAGRCGWRGTRTVARARTVDSKGSRQRHAPLIGVPSADASWALMPTGVCTTASIGRVGCTFTSAGFASFAIVDLQNTNRA